MTSETGWPIYNGDPRGNRYTALTQIDKTTVKRLAPRGCCRFPDVGRLQGTPIVADGLMYVTAPNEIFALDAGSGRQVWHLKRPRTKGIVGGGANRGAAVAGERVFMLTDNAHVIALNRFTGELLWERRWRTGARTTRPPRRRCRPAICSSPASRAASMAPTASSSRTTRRPARRSGASGPCPKPGQPGSETWQGRDIEHGGAPTWFTGSYDAALDIVYWPTGNPSKEYDGVDRKGDNLYANSMLALDRKTGALKWYYQFTPHDLWDWDATQTSVLIDADWKGQRAAADAARVAQRLLLRVRSSRRQAAARRSRSCAT